MLVEAIQVVRQPGRANLQERHAQFGKTNRHPWQIMLVNCSKMPAVKA
jgi:hypothetical protein